MMFTGIVKEIGVVRMISKSAGLYHVGIESKEMIDKADKGDSVSVDGICLTVTGKREGILYFDAIDETVMRTTVKALKAGDKVNLEGSLKAGDQMGGHLVSGHVDRPCRIKDIVSRGADIAMEVEMADEFKSLVVDKGSVALDGVSLTVCEVKERSFSVRLIPHTLKATTLGSKKKGDMLNVEFDIIGKYVQRAGRSGRDRTITEDFLKSKGFI
jgi:riboflavin synthase